MELAKSKKKLDRLKKKYPGFSKFLENYEEALNRLRDESGFDIERNDDPMESSTTKMLTCSMVDVLCQQVTGQPNLPALTNLVNAYHAACRYGTENVLDENSVYKIQDPKPLVEALLMTSISFGC